MKLYIEGCTCAGPEGFSDDYRRPVLDLGPETSAWDIPRRGAVEEEREDE